MSLAVIFDVLEERYPSLGMRPMQKAIFLNADSYYYT